MDHAELTKALAERGSPWQADANGRGIGRKRWLAGVPEMTVEDALQAASSNLQPPRSSRFKVPAAFNWQSEDASLLGQVRDQSTCCSCAAFAVCAVMEARLRLQGDFDAALDLSEADLFFCGGGVPEVGMAVEEALGRARKHGVGREEDFPYDPAAAACVAVPPVARVTGFQYVVDPRERRLAISEGGPVVAVMRVYEDFIDYTGGVYENVAGASEGLHAVMLVGYDDAQQCWTARNSWGPEAGEGGFFRIKYGQCEIDARPFYALDVEKIR
jgi:C1A family cysteine protease